MKHKKAEHQKAYKQIGPKIKGLQAISGSKASRTPNWATNQQAYIEMTRQQIGDGKKTRIRDRKFRRSLSG